VNLGESYSNILPEDYVGPTECARCHQEKFERWWKHPHRRMNQLPGPDTVLGDFSDRVVKLGNASVTFARQGGAYLMSVERAGQLLRKYRVTRTVGSRFMQFYIGLQLEGPEPAGHAAYTTEHKLPFGYWFRLRRWLPADYFDPGEGEKLRDGVPQYEGVDRVELRPYTQHCMNCHNTYPYAYRVFRPELAGFPDATVGAVPHLLSAALAPTVAVEPTVESFAGLNRRLDPDRHLVTFGVSCESCHFGGREHARHQEDMRFLPTSRMTRVLDREASRPHTSSRKNPTTVLGICAQCHSARVATFPNGAAVTNSREALDLHGGACASQISCVRCHEPHTAGAPSGGTASLRQETSCVRCHQAYEEPAKARAHSRHGDGVSCLDCHMPRYTQGLDEVIRTHRIAVPLEESLASRGLANACNLCHLDRSLNWTLRELGRGWGRHLKPGPGWADAYAGSLDKPVGEVWLGGPNHNMRLVATQAYARSPLGRAKLPEVLRALDDPVPVNRVFARIAAERLLGRPLGSGEYEVTAPPAVRARQVEALLTGPGKRWTSGR
jgi:predicted CXXCH cytochrome family protein